MSKNTLLQSYVLISELLRMTPNSTQYIIQKQKMSKEELEVVTKIKAKEAVKKCRLNNKTTTDKTHKVEVISNAINLKPDDAKRVDLDNNFNTSYNNNVELISNPINLKPNETKTVDLDNNCSNGNNNTNNVRLSKNQRRKLNKLRKKYKINLNLYNGLL